MTKQIIIDDNEKKQTIKITNQQDLVRQLQQVLEQRHKSLDFSRTQWNIIK
jgi:hypothetical protein